MKHLGSAPVSRTQPDSPGQGAAIPAASTSLSCPVAFGFSHSKALSCQNNLVSCLHSIYNSLRNPERWSCWHFPLFSLWKAWAERCLQQDMNETALNPEAKGKVVGEGHAAVSCQDTGLWHLPLASTSCTCTTINSGRTLLRKSWPDPAPEVYWVFWMLAFKGVRVSLQTFAATSPPVKIYTLCAL